MGEFSNRIAFVVPTRNRPDDLRRMLTSVTNQSCLPDELIVVDGGDETVESVVDEFSALNIKYLRVYPPSLAKQRNAGMAQIGTSITLAGYLDDDLVLEPGAMEGMLAFWETTASEVGGARFNILNEALPKGVFLKTLFLIDSPSRGEVLRSGYQTSIGPVDENKFVRWLSGGVTIWRRSVISQFSYDEWFEGTGFLEDLEYSYRVGKEYKLVVVADASVQHLAYPVRKDKNYLLGKWQSINRMYVVKKNEEMSALLCYWALVGQMLINAGHGVVGRDFSRLQRAWGNIVGLSKVATGKFEKLGGILK